METWKLALVLKENPTNSKSHDGLTNAVVIANIWKVNEPLVVPTPAGLLIIFDTNQKGRGSTAGLSPTLLHNPQLYTAGELFWLFLTEALISTGESILFSFNSIV